MPPSGFSQPIIDVVGALWDKREATEQVTCGRSAEKKRMAKLIFFFFFIPLGRPTQRKGPNGIQPFRSDKVMDYSSR